MQSSLLVLVRKMNPPQQVSRGVYIDILTLQ